MIHGLNSLIGCMRKKQLLLLESSGVNVEMAVFYDFTKFRRKKLTFFLKTNVMIMILQKALESCNFFCKKIGENIFKIMTFSQVKYQPMKEKL
jgi:hypothetical protein